jgi:ferredoxin
MKANYGYKDGSGEYFITIDTEACTGCGDCVTACPAGVFAVVEDEFSLDDTEVAVVVEAQRNKLKYSCAPCKPTGERPPLPCVMACKPQAIEHSW